MTRISSYLSTVAALAAVWLAGPVTLAAASTTTVHTASAAGKQVAASPAVNAAVQEAVAKAAAEKNAGGSGGGAAGSSQAFSKLTGEGSAESGEEKESETQKTTKTGAASSATAPSTGLLVLVFAIAALLLGGIAFYIVRDARGVAPAQLFAEAVSGRDQAARARKRRAKAKAARAARKRNRYTQLAARKHNRSRPAVTARGRTAKGRTARGALPMLAHCTSASTPPRRMSRARRPQRCGLRARFAAQKRSPELRTAAPDLHNIHYRALGGGVSV